MTYDRGSEAELWKQDVKKRDKYEGDKSVTIYAPPRDTRLCLFQVCVAINKYGPGVRSGSGHGF